MRVVDLQLGPFPAILGCADPGRNARQGGGQDHHRADHGAVGLLRAHGARSAAWSSARKEYVEAARGLALSAARIVLRHLLPNCLAADDRRGHRADRARDRARSDAVVSRPRTAEHGTVPGLADLRTATNAHVGQVLDQLFPGMALLVTIMSINLVGDQLRDVLNPRLERCGRRRNVAAAPGLQVETCTPSFTRAPGRLRAVERRFASALVPAKILGLVGESGCGKTVTGFLDPRSGRSARAHQPRAACASTIGDLLGTCPKNQMRRVRGKRHRDDLPGSDDDAQSGAADRHADGRNRARAL